MVSQNLTSWIDGAVWRRPHKNCLSGNWSAEGLWWWWTDYFNAYIIVIRLFIYLYKRARRNAARSKPISNLCWLWPKLSSITRGSDNLLVVIKIFCHKLQNTFYIYNIGDQKVGQAKAGQKNVWCIPTPTQPLILFKQSI